MTEIKNNEIDVKKSFHERQREALGIPASLNGKPVLYVSSHRGFLDSKYKSHREIFRKTLRGEEDDDDEKVSVYVDLTVTDPEQIVDLLRTFIVRDDPSRRGSFIPAQTVNSEPLPAFITNVVYIPKLDENGNANEPSHAFSIDHMNPRGQLLKLKNFLLGKEILYVDSGDPKELET